MVALIIVRSTVNYFEASSLLFYVSAVYFSFLAWFLSIPFLFTTNYGSKSVPSFRSASPTSAARTNTNVSSNRTVQRIHPDTNPPLNIPSPSSPTPVISNQGKFTASPPPLPKTKSSSPKPASSPLPVKATPSPKVSFSPPLFPSMNKWFSSRSSHVAKSSSFLPAKGKRACGAKLVQLKHKHEVCLPCLASDFQNNFFVHQVYLYADSSMCNPCLVVVPSDSAYKHLRGSAYASQLP